MNRNAKINIKLVLIIFLVLLVTFITSLKVKAPDPIPLLIDEDLQLSGFKIEGYKINEFFIDKDLLSKFTDKDYNFETPQFNFTLNFIEKHKNNFNFVKQNILIKNKRVQTLDFNFSIMINISYPTLMWNGTIYTLNSSVQELRPYFKNDTNEMAYPNIFLGDDFKRINYKDMGVLGGYVMIYNATIELRIDKLNLTGLAELFIDPTYYAQTDGFSTNGNGMGADSPQSITTNISNGPITDFWITDFTDDYVYHTSVNGTNLTDGFSIADIGAGAAKGITTNNSDFWIDDSGDNFVYHTNRTGSNITDGFSLQVLGSSNSDGITTNGSDFWIANAPTGNGFVFHTNRTGSNITDGFSLASIGSINPTGITTNISSGTPTDFWITDVIDDFVYHTNRTGSNITDGFSLIPAGVVDATDIVVNINGTDFWIVDNIDDFVYHFNTTPVNMAYIDGGATSTPSNCAAKTTFVTLNTDFPAGNNFIIAPVQLQRAGVSGMGTVQAGNLIFWSKTGNTILATNPFSISAKFGNTHNSYAFIINHTDAPANAVYNISSCSGASTFNVEGKILAFRNLNNWAYNSTVNKVNVTKAPNNVYVSVNDFNTNLSAGNNTIIASVSINASLMNTATTLTFTDVALSRGNTQLENTSINFYLNASVPLESYNTVIFAVDNNAPANANYNVTVKFSAGSGATAFGTADILVFQAIASIFNTTGKQSVGTTRVELAMANTSFGGYALGEIGTLSIVDTDVNAETIAVNWGPNLSINNQIKAGNQNQINTIGVNDNGGSGASNTVVFGHPGSLQTLFHNLSTVASAAGYTGKGRLLVFAIADPPVAGEITSTCTYSSGNWAIDCADKCVLTSSVAIDANYNITISGTGSLTLNGANITRYKRVNLYGTDSSNKCYIVLKNGGGFR